MHTLSQFLMPGLVDCHIHPAQYVTTGIQDGASMLTNYIPSEVAFRNTTVAREVSMALVVSSGNLRHSF